MFIRPAARRLIQKSRPAVVRSFWTQTPRRGTAAWFNVALKVGCAASAAAVLGAAVSTLHTFAVTSASCDPDRDIKGLLSTIQDKIVDELRSIELPQHPPAQFKTVSWLRDGGLHGGGMRYETEGSAHFNRASINVSGVHYEDVPKARVDSATALSVILHPDNPWAPSMHLHVSYMEPRGRAPYWRMIADLNPSLLDPLAAAEFERALQCVMPEELSRDAQIFGDRYFNVPDLGRHRGAVHFFVAKLGQEEMAPEASLERRACLLAFRCSLTNESEHLPIAQICIA